MPIDKNNCEKSEKKYCITFLSVYNRFRSADINTTLKEVEMLATDPIPSIADWDAYINHPVIKARNEEDMKRYYAKRDAEDKAIKERLDAYYAKCKAEQEERDLLSGETARREAAKKAEMEEYWKLFNADKQRFLDMGCSEKTAHAQACGLAQYREDKRIGLSTD